MKSHDKRYLGAGLYAKTRTRTCSAFIAILMRILDRMQMRRATSMERTRHISTACPTQASAIGRRGSKSRSQACVLSCFGSSRLAVLVTHDNCLHRIVDQFSPVNIARLALESLLFSAGPREDAKEIPRSVIDQANHTSTVSVSFSTLVSYLLLNTEKLGLVVNIVCPSDGSLPYIHIACR